MSILGSDVAKVLQGEQVSPSDGTRQAALGGNFREGGTPPFVVECANYLQATGERLDIIGAAGE
jgi:hypothetical protein